MQNFASQKDVGASLACKFIVGPRVIDAGTTTEDAVEISSTAIDRVALTNHPYHSAKVIFPYSFTGAAGATATLKSNFQHSDNSSAGWVDFNDIDGSTANTASIGSTASTAAQTVNGVLSYDMDLSGAKQYVRVQVTPTLSGTSTGTDDLDIAGVLVFGGGATQPST